MEKRKEVPGRIQFVHSILTSDKREEKGYISKHFFLLISLVLTAALVLTIFGLRELNKFLAIPNFQAGSRCLVHLVGKCVLPGWTDLIQRRNHMGRCANQRRAWGRILLSLLVGALFLSRTPIEVSPMRVKSFFNSRGWSVLKSEFVWIWLPGLILVSLSRMVRPRMRN